VLSCPIPEVLGFCAVWPPIRKSLIFLFFLYVGLIYPEHEQRGFCQGHPSRGGVPMKKLHNVLALSILSASLMGGVSTNLLGGVAYAQDQDHHDNHTYVEHKEWKRGATIKHEDWDRADKIDYHQYHLSAPPRGYEWRMVDGNYVLVNSSTFAIRTVIRIP
jgi:Ni/Co efflux regulator RcnB